jgi:polyisoprenoid-binding protein YceI
MKIQSLLPSLALTSVLFSSAAFAAPTEWTIDPAHTSIGFTVPHMVVSEVDGRFKTFTGKALLEEADLTKSTVEFSADVVSIETGDAKRDEHLKSPDFFDAAKFPKLTFTSTKITKAGKGYKLKGNLTIHGVSKEVTLDATLSQAVKNPWGIQVRAAKITGKIKREDFGLSWNKTLDQGGVVVGNEVALDIKLELNPKAPLAAAAAPAAAPATNVVKTPAGQAPAAAAAAKPAVTPVAPAKPVK